MPKNTQGVVGLVIVTVPEADALTAPLATLDTEAADRRISYVPIRLTVTATSPLVDTSTASGITLSLVPPITCWILGMILYVFRLWVLAGIVTTWGLVVVVTVCTYDEPAVGVLSEKKTIALRFTEVVYPIDTSTVDALIDTESVMSLV